MTASAAWSRAGIDLAALAGELQSVTTLVAGGAATVGTTGEALPSVWAGPAATQVLTALNGYHPNMVQAGGLLDQFAQVCTQWSRLAVGMSSEAAAVERRLHDLASRLQYASTVPSGGLIDLVDDLTRDRASAQAALDDLIAEWRHGCGAFGAQVAVLGAGLAAIGRTGVSGLSIPSGPGLQYAVLLAWASSSAIHQMRAVRNDPRAAAAWWNGLTEDQRRALVATRPDLFDGATFATLADAWKAELSSDELRQLYTMRALHKAGIDPFTWRPEAGVGANTANIEAVYQYYAATYEGDPDTLWWSGMAAMIGASFYGGFQDLADTQGMATLIGRLADAGSNIPGFPGDFSRLSALSADELATELRFFSTTLLAMQKEIFLDMGPAHEAYLDGGADMIARLYADDPYGYGPQTIAAWQQIEQGGLTGNDDLIAEGNKTLLYREQFRVIRDDYDHMRDRPISGPSMTYLMTLAGAPSIPGARTFAEVYPLEIGSSVGAGTPRSVFGVPLPNVSCEAGVHVGTPLPSVNVSSVGSRWALIEDDTLPVYVDLARNHPDQVSEILDTPIGERAEDYRIIHRVDDIISSWQLDADAGCSLGLG